MLGVLGHEVGHLKRRHTLRKLIQFSITGAVSAWLVGDVSSVAAGALPVLLGAKYSRDLEREADSEAIALLRVQGLSNEPLIDLLRAMEGRRPGAKAVASNEASTRKPQSARKGAGLGDYLSSHPATEERIRALRGL